MNVENLQSADVLSETMCCTQCDGNSGYVTKAKTVWKSAKLDELGFVGRGKSRHRPRNADFLYGGPYPFFQTGDIKAANFYLTEYSQTYSEEGLKQSKLWKPGTLCITIAANIAESAILGIEGCFPDSVVGFVADPDKADVRFIKYYMEILKLQMQSVSRGTTQDNLSVDKLLSFDFHAPPLPVQRRIAGILSTYDELIENSQRRIKILEEMARALYREWFVLFRFPGHENVPLVSSPLGDIPQGWEVKKLGDLAILNYGKALKKEHRCDGVYPVYGSSGIVGMHDTSLVKGPGIIVGRKGNVGSVFWCDDDFFVIDTAYFLTSSLPLRYLFYVLPTLNFLNSDAAVPGLSRNQAYTLEILVPPVALLKKFCELSDFFELQADTLKRQIQNLRQTRDLLLPRLLSGQLELNKDDL
ncbi:MAG: restriction endonuclease subunit S [Chlorobium sp.]|jgi:type I restriction enzyme S subunit|nr:restriction endonuclease subunit S [Chlorobium sp.]